MVDVIEAYRDYEAPAGTRTSVETLLETVEPSLTAGLGSVVLTNTAALTGSRKRAFSWWHGRKLRHATQARGMYHRAWHGQAAWVELFVDQTMRDTPRWLQRHHLIRIGLLGPVLYHELGHHIHATSHPEYAEPEGVADDWAKRLFLAHARARHPIVRRALQPVGRVAIGLFGRVDRPRPPQT